MRIAKILFILLFTTSLIACKTTTTVDVYGKKSAEQIFTHAEKELAKGNYDTAIKDLEGLDSLYPFSPYAEQVQLNLIYAYYKNSDYDSSLAAADRYLRLYPRNAGVEYALYMKGLANLGRPTGGMLARFTQADLAQLDMSSLEAAHREFSIQLQRFPNGRYAQDARQQIARLVNLMAQHQLEIAEFYMARKAYVAAVNRATRVVSEYPANMPQMPPALAIMVEGYTALNEPALANEARQTLLRRYPNSSEARDLAHP